jgi:hypothetical protein
MVTPVCSVAARRAAFSSDRAMIASPPCGELSGRSNGDFNGFAADARPGAEAWAGHLASGEDSRQEAENGPSQGCAKTG